MKPFVPLLVVPFALTASVALAATTDETAAPDLVPDVEPTQASPAPESNEAASRGTTSLESCATCDSALGSARAARDGLAESSVGDSSEVEERPSEQSEDATHESTRSASLLPTDKVLPSQAGPAPGSKTTIVAKPKATVRAIDDDHFTVLIVAPSGAQTDILLDPSGRILGVRNVERPAPRE